MKRARAENDEAAGPLVYQLRERNVHSSRHMFANDHVFELNFKPNKNKRGPLHMISVLDDVFGALNDVLRRVREQYPPFDGRDRIVSIALEADSMNHGIYSGKSG